MRILFDFCTGCGSCVPYCPSQAISLTGATADVDLALCTECGTCRRVNVCPVEAIAESDVWGKPREIRAFFSDPVAVHPNTSIPGRGTEEVKTNDVTGRVRRGEVGIAIEVGRPCLGTTMNQVELITTALAPLGITYEKNNPMTALLVPDGSGRVKDEYRHERLTSIIIEFTVDESDLEHVLAAVKEISARIDTVFALDLVTCFDDQGGLLVLNRLEALGFAPRPNAKVNLGLGRPAAPLYRSDAQGAGR